MRTGTVGDWCGSWREWSGASWVGGCGVKLGWVLDLGSNVVVWLHVVVEVLVLSMLCRVVCFVVVYVFVCCVFLTSSTSFIDISIFMYSHF